MRLKFSLPKVTPAPSQPPSKTAKLWVITIACTALAAHFLVADIIVGLFATCVLFIKTRIVQLNKKNPPRWAMLLLLGSCIMLVIIQYGGWSGYRSGISFLVALLALKLLESANLRDYFVACLLMYFLAAGSFLFSTSPFAIIVVILFCIGITSAMFILTSPNAFENKEAIKQAGWMMVKAIPLAALLFFFFPRIQADFGFLPGQDETQSDGIGNELSAGDFSNRSFSNELAFRVEFDGEKPDTANLYWRNKTMVAENNFRWQVDKETQNTQRTISDDNSSDLAVFRYQILQEASKDKYLSVLDYVGHAEQGKLLADFSVLKNSKIEGAFSYNAWSSNPAIQNTKKLENRAYYLQSNTKPSKRINNLINSWRQQTSNKQQLVDLVLNYFNQQPFKYSLLPPALGRSNQVDEFLFETKTGYCEHYASVFTLLMRWMDIPSRIVVGFQGGEWNDKGNYYVIRYSDAHAWSEVWLEGKGWVRADPTAMIAPERIEFGMEALFALWDDNQLQTNITGRALSDLLQPKGVNKSIQSLQQTLANISYQWNKWIVNYNLETQKALLQSIGLNTKYYLRNLILIMLISCSLLIAFYFWRLMPKQKALDETEKLYQQFCTILAEKGLNKNTSEGAYSFAKRAAQHFPQSAADIQRITQYYINQRYEKYPKAIDDYKQLVNEFARNKHQLN